MLNRILTGILFLSLYGVGERLTGQEVADTLLTCPGTGPVRYSVVPDAGANVNWQLPLQAQQTGLSAIGDTIAVNWLVNSGFYPIDVYQLSSKGCAGDVSRFIVHIKDTMPPWFVHCLADAVLSNAIGQAWANFTVPAPEAADNVGIERIEGPAAGMVQIGIGQRLFQFIAFDSIGLSDTCQWLVSVNDTEAPQFTDCPPDTTIPSDAGQNYGTLNWLVPTATDNYGLLRVWSDFPDPPQQFNIGITGVNYFAEDSARNLAKCHFNVIVTDNQAPWFTYCPADTVVYVVYGGPVPVYWLAPVAIDNNGAPRVVSDYQPGDSLSLGTTTVQYTATDSANNTASCSFNITLADTTGLRFSYFPADTVMYLPADNCQLSASWALPQTNRPAQLTANMQPDTLLGIGGYTIHYQAESFIGQQISRTFNITVADTVPPSLVVHDLTIVLDSLTGTYELRWPEVVTSKSDNCNSDSVHLSKFRFDCTDVGTQAIAVSVYDNNGLHTTRMANITVQYQQAVPFSLTYDKLKWCSGDTIRLLIAANLPMAWNYTMEATAGLILTEVALTDTSLTLVAHQLAGNAGMATVSVQPLLYGDCVALPVQARLVVSSPVSGLEFRTVNCYDPLSGYAKVSPSGGVEPYSVQWSTGESSHQISGLPVGIYWVKVADSLACQTMVDSFILRPSDSLRIELSGTGVSCFGREDGAVTARVLYGTPPYEFLWNNGQTTPALNNLPADRYEVLVRDGAGCRTIDSLTIVQPDALVANVVADTVWCYSLPEGVLRVSANGGTQPYDFSWTNLTAPASGTTTFDGNPTALMGLYAGTYRYVLSDTRLCRVADTILLAENDPLIINFEVDQPYCPATADGEIIAHVTGITSPYTFNWNAAARDSIVEGAGVGEYTLLVTDRYDCEIADTVMVSPEFDDCIDAPLAFSPNGDGNNERWEIWVNDVMLLHEAYPDAIVEVFDRSGNLLFKDTNGNAQPWDGTYQNREAADDSYFFTITFKGKLLRKGIVSIIR